MQPDGWHPDPLGDHEQRYFLDGRATALVYDDAGGLARDDAVGLAPDDAGGPTRDDATAAGADPAVATQPEDAPAPDHQLTDQPGAPPPPRIPAGWYEDPLVPGQHRYWSGTRWTGLLRARDPSDLFEFSYVSERRAAQAAAPGGVQAGGMSDNATIDTPTAERPAAEGAGTAATHDNPTLAAATVSATADERGDQNTKSEPPTSRLNRPIQILRSSPGPPWLWAGAAAVLLTIGLVSAVGSGPSTPTRSTSAPTTAVPPATRSAGGPPATPPRSDPPMTVAPTTTTPPTTTAPAATPAPVAAPTTTSPAPRITFPIVAAPPVPSSAPATTSPPTTTTATTALPSNHVLTLATGSGIGTTQVFAAPGAWSVLWKYDCTAYGAQSLFDFEAHTADGSVTDIYGPGQIGTGGTGVLHYTEPGTFELVVNTPCNWALLIASQ